MSTKTYTIAQHPIFTDAFAVIITNRYGTWPVVESDGSARCFRTKAEAVAFIGARGWQ